MAAIVVRGEDTPAGKVASTTRPVASGVHGA
jgi:hypothetical protein